MSSGGGTTSTSTLNKAQWKVNKELGDQVLGGLKSGTPQYSGQMMADLNPGFKQIQSMLDQYNPSQNSEAIQSALSNQLSGKPAYNLDPKATENLFQNSIMNPMMREFQQRVSPQIRQQFAAAGRTFSGAAGNAQARALGDMMSQGQSQLAQAVFSNQGLAAQLADSAAARQANAIGMANQQSLVPLTQASLMSQALAPFQQHAQSLLDANYQRWAMNQAAANPWQNQAQTFLGQNTLGLSQKPTFNYAGMAAGAAGGLLSGAASGAAIGAAGGPIGMGGGALIGLGMGLAGGAR